MKKATIGCRMGARPAAPPDGGWGWIVVGAAFFLNLLNGAIFSVHGVLYEAFLQSYPELTPPSAAWLISLQAGLCYVAGLSTGPVLAVWSCRQLTVLGSVLMVVGLAATAFAPNSPCLYIAFSVLTGLGMGFQCLPSSILVQMYFERNRALSGAIAVSGGTMGVFVYPPIAHLLMVEYGWRGMVLILSGIVLNSVPMGLLLLPLPTPSDKASAPNQTHCLQQFRASCGKMFRFPVLRKSAPWVTMAFWFLTYSGVSGVYTSLTVRCTSLAFPRTYAPMLISVTGITETLGRVLSGVVGNLKCVNRVYLFCGGIFICGISSVIAGRVVSYPVLVGYSAVYGLNIGVFVGLGVTVVVDLMGKDLLPHVLGFNFFAGGIGNFIALPSLALALELTGDYGVPFFLLGTSFILAAVILIMFYLCQRYQRKTKTMGDIQQHADQIL